jgi:hypothetical protein
MMRLFRILSLALMAICCWLPQSARSQQQLPSQAVLDYVATYRAIAIREMNRTGVPAAITLAQGILETEAGKSDLVQRSNNHFGIKCKSSWTGDRVYHDDDAKGECFRAYAAAEESYRDHSDYLKTSERYASLFRLDPEDYKGWAHGLRKAGYATNPQYANILIRYIEDYQLQDYTLIALGRKPAPTDLDLQAGTTAVAHPLPQPAGVEKNYGNYRDNRQLSAGIANMPPYPDGEFRFNETRVVYARSGTSLLSLADQFHVRLAWLLEFNELEPGTELLPADQLVYLQRKRRHGEHEFHIVQPGETLVSISQAEGLRLENLRAYNKLNPGMEPAPGETLYLRGSSPDRPKLAGMPGMESDGTRSIPTSKNDGHE